MLFGRTSERQIEANRINAQKSHGPVTQAGKAKSSLNRTKHGLTGSFQLFANEDVQQFEELLAEFMKDEKPVGIPEVELVKTMVQHLWCTRRADALMNSCFCFLQETGEREAELAIRPELERYMRYQSHHQRAYQRAANELLKRRKERRLEEIGFESQKRAQAKEDRAVAGETRTVEKHKSAVALTEMKLQLTAERVLRETAANAKRFNLLERAA
jgi:hypothetical protein